jgi:hypothetical protein
VEKYKTLVVPWKDGKVDITCKSVIGVVSGSSIATNQGPSMVATSRLPSIAFK